MIDQELKSNLNSLIKNTLEEEKKMEEDLDFFFNNNATQPNKKIENMTHTK